MKKFAAIFDMDGVIVDSNPWHKISLDKFADRYGKSFSDEEMRKHLFGRRNAEWIPYFFGGDLSEQEVEEYGEEKERIFREVYKDDIAPLPGLMDFLQQLEARQVARAIATSAPPSNVEFTIRETGIERFFETILDSRFVEEGKPHPQIYLKTAQTLGFAPQDCVVFEDSLAGVEAGLRAGSKVIGVTTTHTAEEMEGISMAIKDFSELTIEKVAALFA